MLASIPSPSSNGIHLGPLFVHAYGMAYVVGVAAAVAIATRRWEAKGGSRDLVHEVALWGFPAGLIGGHLYFLATSWNEVPPHWWGPLAWRIYLLNPTAWIVFGFQRALYHSPDANAVLAPFTTSQLGVGLCLVIVILLVLLYATWRIFFGLSGDFAEEL